MVAGQHAYNKVIVPQLDLWQHLFGHNCRSVFHEDNESMIQVIRTGRNPTMRQLGRVHRVAIAVLHERLGDPKTRDSVDLIHTPSKKMSADIYTKPFVTPDEWLRVCINISIYPGKDLQKTIEARISSLQEVSETPSRSKKKKDKDSGGG